MFKISVLSSILISINDCLNFLKFSENSQQNHPCSKGFAMFLLHLSICLLLAGYTILVIITFFPSKFSFFDYVFD